MYTIIDNDGWVKAVIAHVGADAHKLCEMLAKEHKYEEELRNLRFNIEQGEHCIRYRRERGREVPEAVVECTELDRRLAEDTERTLKTVREILKVLLGDMWLLPSCDLRRDLRRVMDGRPDYRRVSDFCCQYDIDLEDVTHTFTVHRTAGGLEWYALEMADGRGYVYDPRTMIVVRETEGHWLSEMSGTKTHGACAIV